MLRKHLSFKNKAKMRFFDYNGYVDFCIFLWYIGAIVVVKCLKRYINETKKEINYHGKETFCYT